MSKAVLMSIQPKWCEKIASGEKTIEVRKTRPKLETPFKCYIYETQGEYKTGTGIFAYGIELKGTKKGKGKVIGEFVCDSVEMVNAGCSDYGIDLFYHDCITKGCLTESEVDKYFNIPEDKDLRVMKGNGYAWHISRLKIYDKPKELSEFYLQCEEYGKTGTVDIPKKCKKCRYQYTWNLASKCRIDGLKPITKPPQSWCYVEVQE